MASLIALVCESILGPAAQRISDPTGLSEVEVPEVADEGRQDAAPLVAEDLVDQRG